MMYPFVGAINYHHRRTIDLVSGSLRLAVITDIDLSQQENHETIRAEVAARLRENKQLNQQLVAVRDNLELIAIRDNLELIFPSEEALSKFIVIIEDEVVTQVIVKYGETINRRYSVDENGDLTKLEQEPPLLPELYVDGSYVKRIDTGEVIQFKGVALFAPERLPRENILNYVKRNIEANAALGIQSNLVRLSFDANEINAYPQVREEIALVADYLSKNGMYLLLIPHNVRGVMLPLPNDEVAKAMGLLATQLREKTNVLYGLWNEPAEVSWAAWKPWIIKISSAILDNFEDESHKPIIVVSGTKWSRDFRRADIPLLNYIIDVHDYPWADQLGVRDARHYWKSMIGRVPIIISEFGSYVSPYQSIGMGDIPYMRETLAIVNDPENINKLHYTVWRGEDSDDGIRTKSGKLTARGIVLLEDMVNNPTQTDFRK